MAGLAIVQASSDAWPEAGAQAERSLNTGWALDQSLTSTGGFTTAAAPSTATAFLSTGDGTTGTGNGFYAIGRRLRVVSGAASTVTTYGEVTTAAYSTSTLQTTITVGRITSGTTALSTGGMGSAAAGSVFASTDWNTPFPFRLGSWALSTGGHLLAEADDAYDIGAYAATRPRSVYLGTHLSIGTSPSTIGAIRIANAQWLYGRNAADSGNLAMAQVDSANQLRLGGGGGGITVAIIGNDLTVGTGYIAIGTTPATAGAIRLPNAQSIEARNAANTGNYGLASLDASNIWQIAGGAITADNLQTATVTLKPSIAIGTTPATSGVIRLPNSTALVVGKTTNGTDDVIWPMQYASTSLGTAVACTAVGAYTIALSKSLAAGRWLITAAVTIGAGGGGFYQSRIDDGTSVFASAGHESTGTSVDFVTLPVSAIVAHTSAVTYNLRFLSPSTQLAAGALAEIAGSVASTGATYLNAVKIG